MSAVRKWLITAGILALTVIVGWNIYQIHFVPKEYEGSTVFYNGALLGYKNTVARRNTETGLRLEYIGTVDSVTHKTELPDTDFECNSKCFLGAKFYRDGCGRYYLYRSNGDLIMLENCLQK